MSATIKKLHTTRKPLNEAITEVIKARDLFAEVFDQTADPWQAKTTIAGWLALLRALDRLDLVSESMSVQS